jgi:hypothetical protein
MHYYTFNKDSISDSKLALGAKNSPIRPLKRRENIFTNKQTNKQTNPYEIVNRPRKLSQLI